MTSETKNAQGPHAGQMHMLAPHLVCADAASAIDFYAKAFGAVPLMRLDGPDGKLMHGSINIDGAMVMLADEYPEHGSVSPKSLGGTPVTIHRYVADVDAAIARAEKAGARVIMPAADMFWGDRYGVVEDPFGHRWSLATHKRDMSEAEIREAARTAMTS